MKSLGIFENCHTFCQGVNKKGPQHRSMWLHPSSAHNSVYQASHCSQILSTWRLDGFLCLLGEFNVNERFRSCTIVGTWRVKSKFTLIGTAVEAGILKGNASVPKISVTNLQNKNIGGQNNSAKIAAAESLSFSWWC